MKKKYEQRSDLELIGEMDNISIEIYDRIVKAQIENEVLSLKSDKAFHMIWRGFGLLEDMLRKLEVAK